MNYRDLSPEAEGELVPDWIENVRGDWFDTAEAGVCKRFLWMDPDAPTRLCMDTEGGTMALSTHCAPVVAKALQFFAANGRLPRRLGAEGEGS